MTSYRKTMAESLREMYPLDERIKMPRQLIDANKEVMIVKKNKVIVIDKKDQDKYMKQGWELAEEVGLNEGTIDKVKEIASKKQAMKIDGVMVDSFTASAISQIYDKVNDANKKKMDSLPITKLANLAMKMMQKNDYVPEEVDLDEGKMKNTTMQANKPRFERKGQELEAYAKKSGGIDKDDMMKVAAMLKRGDKSGALKYAKTLDTDPKEYIMSLIGEETELDEGKMGDQWQKGAKSVKSGPFELMRGKSGVHAIMQNGKKLGDFSYDDEADNFVANMKGMKGQWVGNDIDSLINHLQKVHKEEVDLDENLNQIKKHIDDLEFERKRMTTSGQESLDKLIKAKSIKDARKAFDDMYGYEYDRVTSSGQESMVKIGKMLGMKMEEVDLEEASASDDARRAMRRDPDMKQRAFSKDDDATDDDKKAASKNIMVQMRKAQSLGYFNVEFQDGKKIKIPAKLAIAVQQKYNAMRKPSDKESFQAKVGKSYRDMLNALKEEAVSPAQQAAIAISKKERGEKPKKESILDRIDRKIKENKNG